MHRKKVSERTEREEQKRRNDKKTITVINYAENNSKTKNPTSFSAAATASNSMPEVNIDFFLKKSNSSTNFF